jgi:hypothetical protein
MPKSLCSIIWIPLAFLVAAVPAAAEEGIPLAFKFNSGDVVQYGISFSGAGGIQSPDGELAPAGIQGNLRLLCTVVDTLADGSGRVQLLTPEASLRVSIGEQEASFSYQGGRIRWSADGTEHAPPDVDVSRIPFLGTPVTVTVAPNGRVTEVTVPGADSLSELQEVAPGLGTPRLEGLGEALFPDHPVRVGESWRRATQMTPLGPSMPVTVTSSRTLDELTEQGGLSLARISGYSEARFRASPMTVSPGEQDITVSVPEMLQTITSTEFFNTTAGRLVRADYTMSMSSTFGVGVGGQQQEAGLEARLQVTVQAR